MNKYCLECDDYKEAELRSVERTLSVKGEDITLSIDEYFCKDCGDSIYDEEQDSKNLLLFYDEYRRRNNLLSAAQIKAIRQKYGLTQVQFARLLGFGDKTITRYERGAIQDEAHDNLIRQMESEENFRKIFNLRKGNLAEIDQRRIETRLSQSKTKIIIKPIKYGSKNEYTSLNQLVSKDYIFNKFEIAYCG